jgi:chromosome segregation ATPase
MRLNFVFGLLMLTSYSVGFTQTKPPDTQALESLVKEIRQLRQDLVSATVAAQRVQIVLYRLQGQEAAVQQAETRHDLAHEKLAGTLARSQSEAERKDLQDQVLPYLKAELAKFRHLEQQQQASESESEEQLRTEQAKLSDLQSFLDKLDKTLADFDSVPH